MLQAIFGGYLGILISGTAKRNNLQSFLNTCLAASGVTNLIAWRMMNKLKSTFVYKLEFDTSSEQFVLTKPGGVVAGV